MFAVLHSGNPEWKITDFTEKTKVQKLNWFCSQSSVKMYHMRYIDDFNWIIQKVQSLYKVHITTESLDRIQYFRKFALFTEILFKVMTAIHVPLLLAFLSYPIFVYLTTSKVVPVVPMHHLPMINGTTAIGYTVTAIHHMGCVIFTPIGYLAFEFFMATIITSSLIFGKLISTDLEQINMDLLEKDSRLITAKARFRNVLLMQQEMGE